MSFVLAVVMQYVIMVIIATLLEALLPAYQSDLTRWSREQLGGLRIGTWCRCRMSPFLAWWQEVLKCKLQQLEAILILSHLTLYEDTVPFNQQPYL